MFQRRDFSHLIQAGGRGCSTALAAWLLFGGVAAAQDSRSAASKPASPVPAATPTPLSLVFTIPSGVEQPDARATLVVPGGKAGRLALPRYFADLPAAVRRITLQQAQQMAAAATNPLERLGQLQVEAAEQHRLGVKSNYYPNIAAQAYGLRLSSSPGELLTVQRPLTGSFLSVPVNIIDQGQFAVNVAALQPITPLFAVRQLVKIARADENIARAKAGMPVTEQASIVEKSYFDLLIAERELISAGSEAKKVQAKWMAVSDSGTARISTEQQADAFGAAKSMLLAASRVKELTAAFNDLLGLPSETRLELVPPDPLVENLSLNEATANATTGSAEVVEAEQTAIKAHAGAKLSKMEYFPTIAVMGGYTHQDVVNVILKENFGYIGVIGTYTLFNGGKRESGVKEARAQAEAADLGVQLTKAKVAGAVKTGYLRLERSRQLYQLARWMLSAARVVEASYMPDGQDIDPARAKLEAELFRADLEYRQAYAQVKNLISTRATDSASNSEGVSGVRE
jgi:outer membrane protein TolC